MLLLLACSTPDPDSNLCGTVQWNDATPPAEVYVVSVLDGEVPCSSDTGGGGGWWDETVATPELAGNSFDAEVPAGVYGVEVIANGGTGCAEAVVTDTDTCATEVLIELGYMVTADKPNVYLYPPVPTDIGVRIPAANQITVADPPYPHAGWQVRARPDGLLKTPQGARDYLFYELMFDPRRFQTTEGWCAPGSVAQVSIEDAMADMGFLPNEIADFSDAWDVDFPEAEWMTVYPQVEGLSQLVIEPKPEHLLRAWFYVTEGCDEVLEPELITVPRTGFHAAEWGVAIGAGLTRGELPVVLQTGMR